MAAIARINQTDTCLTVSAMVMRPSWGTKGGKPSTSRAPDINMACTATQQHLPPRRLRSALLCASLLHPICTPPLWLSSQSAYLCLVCQSCHSSQTCSQGVLLVARHTHYVLHATCSWRGLSNKPGQPVPPSADGLKCPSASPPAAAPPSLGLYVGDVGL